MKSYTDLEQSRKLTEILPLESADMCYIEDKPNIGFLYEEYKEFGDTILQNYYPCWSLAALISIIPYGCLTIHVQKKYRVVYNPNIITKGDYDNPVDACYEMIIKLHELNLL